MKVKDKRPHNKLFQPHGYWETYYNDRDIWYKGNYINGKNSGYWEIYERNSELALKIFYIL